MDDPERAPDVDPARDAAKLAFGRRLKAAREARGLTQSEAAQQLGITKAAVSAWEVGRTLPDALMLAKLGRVYVKTADALLGDC